MLVFETVAVATLGVLAGAELVNLFMLGRLMGSVVSVFAPVEDTDIIKRDHVAAQALAAESHGPSATARPLVKRPLRALAESFYSTSVPFFRGG